MNGDESDEEDSDDSLDVEEALARMQEIANEEEEA